MKWADLTDVAKAWLETRGLDSAVCERHGIRTAHFPNQGEWLAIPYLDGGRAERFKLRKLDAKRFSQWPKGAPKRLWNRAALDNPNHGALVITEGELDALVAIQSGWRAVAFGDGAPGERETGEARYEAIRVDLEKLHAEKQIILAVDDDEPGRRLYLALVSRLGGNRCFWVTYPPGCKDLNDVLLSDVPVGEVLQGAKLHNHACMRQMSQVPREPVPEVYRFGVPALDACLGFVRGHVSVWTGIPSHGKSTLVNWLVVLACEQHDWRAGFASFEQKPRPHHEWNLKRLRSRAAPSELQDGEEQELERWIDDHFVFITPPNGSASQWHVEEDMWADLQWVMEMAKTAVTQFGIDILIIDPWNELEHTIPRGWSETNYVGFALRQIRRMAEELDIHVAIVAHPRKMAPQERPTLYDISGSANWFNKPDLGCVIWRDPEGATELQIDKVRYEELLGPRPRDAIRLEFDPRTRHYRAIG